MSVLVITTGGTIGAMPYDDIYRQPIFKTMPPKGTDVVRTILEREFSQYGLRIITLEQRDSNFINEEYRRGILQKIEQAQENRILITHGTDTILQTAEFFYDQRESSCALRDKIVVLTGSMVAISCGPESDGFLTIPFALSQLSYSLKSGVYIVLCDYDDVQAQTGWSPRLYPFTPKKYGKIHDLANMRRDRLYLLANQESNQ
ncbi:MAG: asparaginase domain-containing protein [Alphaproteobacteria bacterium]|nr:asparaginase domain-containing protein [Alphaproteobacteria bacterium]